MKKNLVEKNGKENIFLFVLKDSSEAIKNCKTKCCKTVQEILISRN